MVSAAETEDNKPPRSTLFVGLDTSGSFRAAYDDALTFVAYYLYGVFRIHYLLALAASAVTVAAVGLVFERLFFRRVLRVATREESTMLLAAGTALLLDSLGLVVFGEKQRGVPPVVPGVYRIAGAYVPAGRALIFLLALGLAGAFLLFMQYTRPGRALRAIAQDKEAATLQGVDLHRYSALGFAIGAGLAGVAGGLLVTVFAVNAGAGTPISIKAFIMIMIGGAGVVSGAILGAFVITILPEVIRYIPATADINIKDQPEIFSGLILLAIILFLPNGLVGLALRFRAED